MATRCVQLGQLLDLVVEGSISYTAPVAAAAPQQGGDEPQDRDTDDASCSEDEPQDHDTYDAAGSEDELEDRDIDDASGSEDASE